MSPNPPAVHMCGRFNKRSWNIAGQSETTKQCKGKSEHLPAVLQWQWQRYLSCSPVGGTQTNTSRPRAQQSSPVFGFDFGEEGQFLQKRQLDEKPGERADRVVDGERVLEPRRRLRSRRRRRRRAAPLLPRVHLRRVVETARLPAACSGARERLNLTANQETLDRSSE